MSSFYPSHGSNNGYSNSANNASSNSNGVHHPLHNSHTYSPKQTSRANHGQTHTNSHKTSHKTSHTASSTSTTTTSSTSSTVSKVSAAATRRQEITQLPRSVRWRLSLDLLTVPPPETQTSSSSSNANANARGRSRGDATLTTHHPLSSNGGRTNNSNSHDGTNESQNQPSTSTTTSTTSTTTTNASATTNTTTANSSGPKSEMPLLKTIEKINALKLRCQRSRYQELEQRHYWMSTPMGIAGMGGTLNDGDFSSGNYGNNGGSGNGGAGGGSSSMGGGHMEGMHHIARGEDPLSSFLHTSDQSGGPFGGGSGSSGGGGSGPFGGPVKEESTRKLFGNRVFGGKKLRNASGGNRRGSARDNRDTREAMDQSSHSSHHSSSLLNSILPNSNSSNHDQSHHSQHGEDPHDSGEDAAVCKGSRWADFYSTREVLDVIEKDLNRLPSDHYTIHHEWRKKCQQWRESKLELEERERKRRERKEREEREEREARRQKEEEEMQKMQKMQTRREEEESKREEQRGESLEEDLQGSSSSLDNINGNANAAGVSSNERSDRNDRTDRNDNGNGRSRRPVSKWNLRNLSIRGVEFAGGKDSLNSLLESPPPDPMHTSQPTIYISPRPSPTTVPPVEETEEERRQKQLLHESQQVELSIQQRANRLSRILFVYAREHPEVGYRQGMHEVLSYVLLVLEMDLLEEVEERERRKWREDVLSPLGMGGMGMGGVGMEFLEETHGRNGSHNSNDEDIKNSINHNRSSGSNAPPRGLPRQNSIGGGMAGVDSSGNLVVIRLLDPNYILHDAFSLFEAIMTTLAPAYDAMPVGDDLTTAMLLEAKEQRGESPMEAMTSSIASKIRYIARDEQLFGHILYMPVPPPLYFAKWVRLLFGREVAGGKLQVMRLWDAFFDLACVTASLENHSNQSNHSEVPISMALMNVLKTAAAAMILLIRDKLLAPTLAWDGTMTGDPDPNEGIGYLMNYPPLEDIGPLVECISNLLVKERKILKMYHAKKNRENRENKDEPMSPPTYLMVGHDDLGERLIVQTGTVDQSRDTSRDHMKGSVDHPLQVPPKNNVANGEEWSLRPKRVEDNPLSIPTLKETKSSSPQAKSKRISVSPDSSPESLSERNKGDKDAVPQVIGKTLDISTRSEGKLVNPYEPVQSSQKLNKSFTSENNQKQVEDRSHRPNHANQRNQPNKPMDQVQVGHSDHSETTMEKRSLANIAAGAAGLFGFLPKTVDAAGSVGPNNVTGKGDVSLVAAEEHPLQCGFPSTARRQQIKRASYSSGNLLGMFKFAQDDEDDDDDSVGQPQPPRERGQQQHQQQQRQHQQQPRRKSLGVLESLSYLEKSHPLISEVDDANAPNDNGGHINVIHTTINYEQKSKPPKSFRKSAPPADDELITTFGKRGGSNYDSDSEDEDSVDDNASSEEEGDAVSATSDKWDVSSFKGITTGDIEDEWYSTADEPDPNKNGLSELENKLASKNITVETKQMESSTCGLDESSSSLVSGTRSIGPSIKKNPKQLAKKLEKSVKTLMKHFNDQINARAKEFSELTPRADGDGRPLDIDPSNVIPDDIWEAMADIDLVRKELMLQNAIDGLESRRDSSTMK